MSSGGFDDDAVDDAQVLTIEVGEKVGAQPILGIKQFEGVGGAMDGFEHVAELCLKRQQELVGKRAAPRRGGACLGRNTRHHLQREGAENLLLAFEVEIDGALGDRGFAGDVVDGGALETVTAEEGERGGENRSALLVACSRPLGSHKSGNCLCGRTTSSKTFSSIGWLTA